MTARLGKDVVPDDSPCTTGGIGLLGTEPSELALKECDILFMIGTRMAYAEYYPAPGAARRVQQDRDPTRSGRRYPVDVGLCGDARATLQALIPLPAKRSVSGLVSITHGEVAGTEK